MTPAPDHAARAAEVRALSNVSVADKLDEAALSDVLLYGLSNGDPDPVLGILGGVRVELHVLAGYAAHPDVDRERLEEGIQLAGYRLDVALELLHRLRRPAWAQGKEGES
jgi:hypothetical protein